MPSDSHSDGAFLRRVLIVASVVVLALLAWQNHVIRHTRSVAIGADHVHYQSDLLLNLAVIAALALVLLRKSGARPEAIRHLRSTADLYPRARLALAQAYAEEKHIDEAAAELRLYLQNRNAEHRPQVEAMLRSFAQSR